LNETGLVVLEKKLSVRGSQNDMYELWIVSSCLTVSTKHVIIFIWP